MVRPAANRLASVSGNPGAGFSCGKGAGVPVSGPVLILLRTMRSTLHQPHQKRYIQLA
jgi:hypothetical protein